VDRIDSEEQIQIAMLKLQKRIQKDQNATSIHAVLEKKFAAKMHLRMLNKISINCKQVSIF
jgi:hypothetical protein